MDEKPTVRDNPGEARFELRAEGSIAGRVTYHHRHGVRVLDHTEVDDAYAGRGYGSALARGVFQSLQADGEKVQLQCPYLERWLAKNPAYADLVTTPDTGAGEA